MDLHEALREYFGFPMFRPGQEAALSHVLAGRDTLVVMPTGSGKSLIYQLAALLLPGTALVISPLVALMKDQVDGLARRRIPATFINSSLDAAEQSRRLRALAEGKYRIVLVAPERLRNGAFRMALRHVPLSLLAVDEAHCLSQWGHDFRPDYLHLADARREFNPPVTLALTATATPRVQDDIIRLLGLTDAVRLVTGFNRPSLTLEVFSTSGATAKLNFIREFLAQAEGAGIIYTGTRRDAEEVAEFARDECRLDARHYHGALDAATRTEVQDAFMSGDLPLVVATNAFGMGIDRPDVRFVLHHALPSTLEAYYQEAGRAGRDGLPARAVLLYSARDTALHEHFIQNDSPTAPELRAAHTYFARQPANPGLTYDEIENATGLTQTKARLALEQLQAAGALRRSPDEAFGRMRVQALPLSEPALRAVAQQVAQLREHKRDQLARMVDYAQTEACRRRTLLDHFGDRDPAEAPICCDNCLARAEPPESAAARPAETQSERAALIVLDTLSHLGWGVGRSKLAHLLKGSASKETALYARARNFGKFGALRLTEIESLIGQLIDAGYLKHVGSDRPTLQLTSRAESALQARTAIQVNLRPVQPAAARRVQAQKAAGGTVALTGQMLARGLAPDRIAAERALTLGTIYSHLALLISEGKVDVKAVMPVELQAQIRAAIDRIGSAEFLAPIKARLPETIEYDVIRCVANAWKREHGGAS
jgi:ATP-dependent DNA helicase RecQ